MTAVMVSSEYRIVIPRELRGQLRIEPGQRLQAFVVYNRLELVPIQPLQAMRGFLSGIETSVRRQPELR